MRHSRQNAFSLVELIIVMSLMVLMATFVTPAVKSLTSANGLTAAGNLVASMVEQARQRSMSGNVLTALVLITNGDTERTNRVIALLEYNTEESVPQWRQVTKWQHLPNGIVVDNQCTFISNSVAKLPFAADAALPVDYHGTGITSFASRVFLPNGGLYTPSAAAEIRLIEGIANSGAANYYNIAIIGSTGRGKIERP
ncbi:MAG: Tfp pilus assembly protein FimT/FimU [Chthoniobacteraceae bacterium]